MAQWKSGDGSLIHFELYDRQPGQDTLLLLPGMLGSTATQWQELIEPLAARFRVILTDLRGHGRSENRAPQLQAAQMLDDVMGLLDYLGLERVHVAGYSLGGYLGLMLALNQPRRVATLMMHATKFYWTRQSASQMRQQLDPDNMSQRVPAYAEQLAREHGARHWRTLVRQAADLVAMLVDDGIKEDMARRCACPAIVSVGDRDELVPLPEALRLSRLLPQGGLLVLPGVSHPFHTIQPRPFLATLQSFVLTGR